VNALYHSYTHADSSGDGTVVCCISTSEHACSRVRSRCFPGPRSTVGLPRRQDKLSETEEG
jgi:hypothetical protein